MSNNHTELKGIFCLHLPHPSRITSKFFFYFHFYTCLSSVLFASFSSFHSSSLCTTHVLPRLCPSFVYICFRRTKAGHVGMHVQQIWPWLCDSRDEPLDQRHSSLIRWLADINQNHKSLSVAPSPASRVMEELRGKKRPVSCHLTRSFFSNNQRKWVLWVSVLAQ